jgi:NlpC/P60 family putative phage cell wall peptidase
MMQVSNAITPTPDPSPQGGGERRVRRLTRAEIVTEARAWIGTPYRHQASLKGVGCDCLGLVRGVWRATCGDEPEAVPVYSRDWAEAAGCETLALAAGRHLTEVPCAQVRPGDVLLFRWRPGLVAKHAAIAVATDRMVHAHDGAAVAEIALAPWWRRRLAFAFRFPGVID